jgi:hypothetical protein
MAGGLGGVPPQIQKRGRVAHISEPCHEWGPKRWQTFSLRGWAKGVQGGGAPMAGAVGGALPQIQKRGRGAHINKPATSGTQNSGKPSAYGVGKTGVQGAKPPAEGWPAGAKCRFALKSSGVWGFPGPPL